MLPPLLPCSFPLLLPPLPLPPPPPPSTSPSLHFPLHLPLPYPLTGKSDPFCRLGILPLKYQDSHQLKHKNKNLDTWQKEGMVKEVVTTTVKPATLTPEWGERFEL